jgi:hypothetical protein
VLMIRQVEVNINNAIHCGDYKITQYHPNRFNGLRG